MSDGERAWRRLRIFMLSLLADGYVGRVVTWTTNQWDTYSSGWMLDIAKHRRQQTSERQMTTEMAGRQVSKCRAGECTSGDGTSHDWTSDVEPWTDSTVGSWLNEHQTRQCQFTNFSQNSISRSTELLSRCRNVDFSFYVCTWQRLTKKWLDFTVRAGHTTIDVMGHSSRRQVRRQRCVRCTARHSAKIERDRYTWKRGDWRDNVAHNNTINCTRPKAKQRCVRLGYYNRAFSGDRQLADKLTRWQDNSLTNQLADIRCMGLRKHWHGE